MKVMKHFLVLLFSLFTIFCYADEVSEKIVLGRKTYQNAVEAKAHFLILRAKWEMALQSAEEDQVRALQRLEGMRWRTVPWAISTLNEGIADLKAMHAEHVASIKSEMRLIDIDLNKLEEIIEKTRNY